MSKQDRITARRRESERYPRLDDILNRKSLDRHLGSGTISAATHPRLPLIVYNYTGQCERRRAWDQSTVICRGLVRDNKSRVIGQPFAKFFGWQQRAASAVRAVHFSDPWYAVEKLDGTMIVAANFDGHLTLSTRGSFDAWQIERAAALWPTELIPEPGITWVLEYVGPENQIVVPYHQEELGLLAVIDNWSGADRFEDYATLCATGRFRVPQIVEANNPDSLLALCAGDGTAEGWVCVWPRKGKPSGRLKVKHPGWLTAHAARYARPRTDRYGQPLDE